MLEFDTVDWDLQTASDRAVLVTGWLAVIQVPRKPSAFSDLPKK